MQLLIAFMIDMAAGDPPWLPHPVVFIGRFISFLEKRWRDMKLPQNVLRLRGALLVLIVLAVTLLSVVLLLRLAVRLHPLAGQVAGSILLATTLAARSLSKAAADVSTPLRRGDIGAARQAVSMIVGRDTEHLEESEVARAAVETVAENTVDGVTAPLFYALLGGVPLAMAYKAVNTMDSMLGYKDSRFFDFGYAAAKLDDFANWLPARLTAPVMLIASAILRFDTGRAWLVLRRDGGKHPSPNSGLPEALAAGAMGIILGGENRYNGVISFRPELGAGGRTPGIGDIPRATRLMWVTSSTFLVFGLAIRLLYRYFAGKPVVF